MLLKGMSGLWVLAVKNTVRYCLAEAETLVRRNERLLSLQMVLTCERREPDGLYFSSTKFLVRAFYTFVPKVDPSKIINTPVLSASKSFRSYCLRSFTTGGSSGLAFREAREKVKPR